MNPSIPTRVARALAAVLVVATVVVSADAASADEGLIVFDGGGWGHGVGMPQYAARGMADDGYTHDDILEYWYQGTGLAPVSSIGGVPDPIRVGINYVLVGGQKQYRPFKWQEFSVVQDTGSTGVVTACLPGEAEGSCSITIDPGVTWRYQWFDAEGGFCSLTRAGSTVYSHATACEVRLYWTDQPNTRISFPGGDVARTFARGHIAFLAPVTRSWNGSNHTGFHFNVVLGIDEYVYGLAEMPVSWPEEALEAQVVAARTYAARKAKSGLRSDCSCHVVWDTFDQAYRGWHSLNEGNTTYGHRWKAAVDNTAGEVVVYPAGSTTMAGTFYSSSTGGASENVWDVWGPDTPSYRATYAYLATQPDPWSGRFAGETSTIRWSKSMTPSAVAAALGFDEIFDIRILALRESGSPSDIVVDGLIGSVPTESHYTGNQLASALGLRSHYIYSITMPGSEGTGGGTPQDLAASIGVHDSATGIFSLYAPDTGGSTSFYYGNPADIPYSGDWNGDGITTLGLYRVSAGYLFLRNSNTQGIADIQIFYGNPGDLPLAGDWNGDGKETIGIYRPSRRTFYLRNSNTQGIADIEFAWGNNGDIPLAGDWNGDGITTVGVYRPSTKMLYLTNGMGGASDIVYHYSGAQSGDRIIVGDWDGDGRDTVGVYRPATATFYLRNSYTAPNADHIIVFGTPNRTPVSGHWG